MAFSLSHWFKAKPEAPGSQDPTGTPVSEAAPTSPEPVAPIPSVVRTVVPNSVQPISLRMPGSGGPRGGTGYLPVSVPTVPRGVPTAAAARGKISFGGASEEEEAAPVEAPAALADVNVSLEVGDFLDRLPPNLVQSGNVDRHRRVEFRASELYSDLTKGRASVPVSVIYQKCPDLFSRPVGEEEDTEVALPLQKLVEQMSHALQTRSDQVAEENVGEIETPFLQVALEDSARLPKAVGTNAGALRPLQPLPPAESSPAELSPRPHRTGQISAISPLKPAPEPLPMPTTPVVPNSAPINAAKRPPSTVRASVAGGKIRLSGPTVPNRMVVVAAPPPVVPPPAEAPATELPPSASQRILPPLQITAAPTAPSPSHQVSKKTARIQIPPISLRGPGGPSRPAPPPALPVQSNLVPVRPKPSAAPAAPAVTFRSSPPPAGAKPMPHSFAPPPARPVVPPPPFPIAPPAAEVPVPAPVSAAPVSVLAAPVPLPAVLVPPPAAPVPAPAADQRRISLSLTSILRGLPMSALTVEPNAVPDDVRISLPFSLIEPQLAHGRVAISQALFAEALPENHREVLATNSGLAEIPLPLQEVFQNLPPAALAIRQDQVIEEIGNLYPTPFSQKADEDAQRFEHPAAAILPTEPPAPAPVTDLLDAPASPSPVIDRPPAESESKVETVAATPAAAPVTSLPDAPESSAPVVDQPPAEAESDVDVVAAAPVVEDAPAAKQEEAAPPSEFADLFVEDPTPIHDIPLDLDDSLFGTEEKPENAAKPADVEKSPVEAHQPGPEQSLDEPKAVSPESSLETAVPEQVAAAFAPSLPTPPEKHLEEVGAPEPEKAAVVEPPPVEAAAPSPEVADLPPVEPQLAAPTPPIAGPSEEHAQVVAQTAEPEATAAPVTGGQDSVLQTLFMTEDELDAKSIVRLVSALPGLEGCAVMFEDGLQLAGNFPVEADAEGFSAMAPPFFKRARNFVGEINLGALHAFSLHTERGLVSFFMHEQICLAVRQSGRGFLPGVREKLEVVTRELARMYATAPQPH